MSNTDTDPTNDLVYRPQPNQPPPQTNDLVQRSTDLSPQLNDLVQRNPPQSREPSPATGDLGPPEQGKPPPQWPPQWRPNRQQHYVPSMANRSPGDLGKPPVFPDLPNTWEVPGIYHGVARQLGQWGGGQNTRQLAQRLGQFTQSYTQGIHRGQRELSRERYRQMTQAARGLQDMLEREMTDYASVYNTFSSSPDQMHTEMMNRAVASGDMEMQAALNHSPQTAERLLQWRQAKLDDLHKSNRAQRDYEEGLRARNPFMINPTGPDGTPTARLPKPFDTTPQRMTEDNIQLAGLERPGDSPGAMSQATDPFDRNAPGPEDVERDVEHPPETTNDPRYEPSWMTGRDPNLTIENLDRPQNGAPESRRDDRTRLAQADTDTATDAPTLPQITVRPGDEDQAEEGQDGRTVWDDVRLRSQLREAREQGGTSGGPSGQPPSATGAQPGQPSPTGQPQDPAGQRGQGQPAPAVPQAPDQAVPPQARTPAQAAPPAAGGQRPLTMTPALTQAQQGGLQPDEINNIAQRHFFGHMTATEFKSLPKDMQRALLAREAEMQGALTNILQGGATGDDVVNGVEKISPSMAADMRNVKAGIAGPPKKDPTGLFRPLMSKYDPSITDQTYANRNTTMKDYITGPKSRNLLSAGTFVRHANRLLYNLEHAPPAVMEAIYKNVPLAVLSRIPGAGETVRIMQEMEADKDAMGAEFATALAQGGGGAGRGATGQERKEQAKNIDLYAPKAAIDRVRELKRLVAERVQQLRTQFEAGTGMSYDAIKKQFDVPGMDELYKMDVTPQQGQGGVIDFRDIK